MMKNRMVYGVAALVWAVLMVGSLQAAETGGRRAWAVDSRTLADEAGKLQAGSPWREAPFFTYVVPPISSVKRLPDTLPSDGELTHWIDLIGALGEFVPASFVVAPLRDVEKLALTASALTQVDGPGRIDSEQVDIKVVKTWWGPGTVWSSYFADASRRELVPNLLLRDENLIHVDLENQENYLRVDHPGGSEYGTSDHSFPSRGRCDLSGAGW